VPGGAVDLERASERREKKPKRGLEEAKKGTNEPEAMSRACYGQLILVSI